MNTSTRKWNDSFSCSFCTGQNEQSRHMEHQRVKGSQPLFSAGLVQNAGRETVKEPLSLTHKEGGDIFLDAEFMPFVVRGKERTEKHIRGWHM